MFVLLLGLLVTGCSSAPDSTSAGMVPDGSGPATSSQPESIECTGQDAAESHPDDPIEGFNRSMWDINYNYLDPYIIRPVSMAYVNYTPSFIRSGIANFFSNLDEPASVVNNLLMGNGHEAVNHFNRFWMNTTFGLFGLFDFAGAVGVPKEENRSFSDAVGHYDVGHGAYVMLPGYGPTTVRNTTDVVDEMYFPLSYLNFWGAISKFVFQGMESRASVVSQEPMLEASPDPYAFTRDAYLQRQDYKADLAPEAVDLEEEAFLDDYLEEEF
jgi:phospholipid-binding lipoprotein MlaA